MGVFPWPKSGSCAEIYVNDLGDAAIESCRVTNTT